MNKKDQIKELQTNSKFTITTTICAVLLITFSVIGASLSKQTYSAANTTNCKCVSNPAVSGGCGYTTSDVSSPGCELEGQPCSCPGGTGSSSSSSNPSSSKPSSSSQSGCKVSFVDGNLELAPGSKSTVTARVSDFENDSTVAGISWTTNNNNIITAGLGSGQTNKTENSSEIGVGYTYGSATLTVTITNSKGGSCSASKTVTVVDKDLSKNGKLTFYNNYGGVYKIKDCEFSNNECTLDLLAFTCPPNYTFEGWTTAANCGGTLNSSGKQIKLTKDSPTASRYACCKDASGGQPSGTGGGGNGGGDNGNTGDNGGGNTNTNPPTGSALIYTVWFIGIAMIGYSVWYFKQNSKIQNQ